MKLTTESEFDAFKQDALAIRKKFLRMHYENQAGHIGTGLSSIDLLTYLYKTWLKPGPNGDTFILSKGHGASALYATLNHFGRLSDDVLATYYKDGTYLPAHPAAGALAEIPAATGSLGHGLSVAAGMAYSYKNLDGGDRRVACLLSDGECNEGSTWEAVMFAAHHNLGKLHVIVDANGLQGFGRTEDVINMEPFAKRWGAFGFEVREIQGHNFLEIHSAFNPENRRDSTKPLCVIARTVKGKGISFIENKMEWHYLPLKEDQYRQAMSELAAAEEERR